MYNRIINYSILSSIEYLPSVRYFRVLNTSLVLYTFEYCIPT